MWVIYNFMGYVITFKPIIQESNINKFVSKNGYVFANTKEFRN